MMEQTIECPLAKMDSNQAKTDPNVREIVGQELLKEEMLARLEAKMDINLKRK
jgi:hypothetical protein